MADKEPALTSEVQPGPTDVPDPDDPTIKSAGVEKELTPPIAELFSLPPTVESSKIGDIANRQISWLLGKADVSEVAAKYRVLILFDSAAIDRQDADRIYKALSKSESDKPILLILHSQGGDVASAYFIGKLCRENTKSTFEVAVPRQAKSAATLICCAADRIHMGSLSELGPIDPQIRNMPALAVKHSLEHLSELATSYPDARQMLSEYLSKSLPIEVLGYYERAAHSAVQYAERLLGSRVGIQSTKEDNTALARCLVYDYKDHGFAIDASEAATVFGTELIRLNSPEYRLANQLYSSLDLFNWYVPTEFNRDFAYTGGAGAGAWIRAAQH